MRYRVAFRNESTEWEWFEIFDVIGSNGDAARSVNEILPDMPNSEIGVFAMNEGTSFWKNRVPRRIFNRQPDDRPIPSAIGGLINDFYKPGKNVR